MYEYIDDPFFGSRSRSFSYHHRPSRNSGRPSCHDNCASVTFDEWSDLVERERRARAANERLTRENRALLASASSRDKEKARLQAEGRGLRADLDARDAALRALRHDKGIADIRVRELTVTVNNQDREAQKLRDDLDRLDRLRKIDQRAARDAWARAEDLQHQLRASREPPSFFHHHHRRYGFV
ncbi:hypothetical protein SAMD00023353_0503180 [Rosellinia necatrix]|uniref:Uncharacterized protein n=1 Tax=Rosellinia necatrix TaxID=77044 RepID=A0A1S7ULG4_ROSNE|nr:hypothetical protein SAMD00023353_0503180 [Rosellinia necatrix]